MPGEPNVHGVSTTKSALSGRALTITIEADYIPPEMVGEISEACEKIAERHCLAERLRIRKQAAVREINATTKNVLKEEP